MNTTEKELAYCEMNDTLVKVTITDVYKAAYDALVGFEILCNETGLVRYVVTIS